MGILNVFNILTLKQILWQTKTFFKKLEYCFLVESTKIENDSFPYKSVTSEANVKTNRIVSTKWTYHKQRSFASNCFIFKKFCSSLRTSCKELISFDVPTTQMLILVLFVSAVVLFDCALSFWVSLSTKVLKISLYIQI